MRNIKGIQISASILFVGIAVSFFAFLNGANLYQRYLAALYEINEYAYRESYSVDIMDSGHGEEIIDAVMECPGIVYLGDTLVYVDVIEKYYGSFLKLLVQNEPLIYPVLEGTIPVTVPDKRQVVLGQNLEEYCQEREGVKYIQLDGEEYEVTGIIGSRNSSALYALDIMYDPDCRQQCIDLLESTGHIDVMMVSNEQSLEEFVLGLSERVQDLGEESTMYYEKGGGSEYADGGMSDKDFYWLICIFSAVNCIIISEFWIVRRKQEIVIRKIWGFDNFRLTGLLYRDLLKISLMAVAFIWLLQFFLVYVLHSDAGIIFDVGKLIQSVAFIAVMAFVIVLLPIYKAAAEMPCTNLEV